MKKIYMKPEVTAIEIKTEANLLTSSTDPESVTPTFLSPLLDTDWEYD